MRPTCCFLFLASFSEAYLSSIQPSSTGSFRRLPSLINSVSSAIESMDLRVENILGQIKKEHEAEITEGLRKFGPLPNGGGEASASEHKWSDRDFVSYNVGQNNVGPDVGDLGRTNEIFMTTDPVLTEKECDDLISEARGWIAQEEDDDATAAPGGEREITNRGLGEARVSNLPRGSDWLRAKLKESLFPLLESRFGVRADDLTLNDALIIGYIGPSRSQPIHRDASIVSLNIALSPKENYTGGGTFFEGLGVPGGKALQNERGHVLCHSSGIMHAGRAVETGQRWVLVLFVVARTEPQFARRCHAYGIRASDGGYVDEAEAAFTAGLRFAPRDHLLLTSLGGVHFSRRNIKMAKKYLITAGDTYTLCHKALISQGKLLLSEGKPRAALRRFDTVLDRIDGSDQAVDAWMPLRATAWDARNHAVSCTLMCGEYIASTDKYRDWSIEKLPEAIQRLYTLLLAAPGDDRLVSMLSRAEELLEEAEVRKSQQSLIQ